MARRPSASRGFTLIEASVVLAVSAIVASIALPSFSDQLLRSRRTEATSALQRLQWAQERHLAQHGRYAASLAELRSAPAHTEHGHYALALRPLGADGYEAVAVAQARQARDADCLAITLQVRGVLSQREPAAKCWGP
jgi:type IV pilus assembly protein PilE